MAEDTPAQPDYDIRTMPRRWKLLIITLVISQIATLWACAYLFDYVLWLRFSDSIGDSGLLDTGPGMKTAFWVLLFLVPLTLANIFVFNRHTGRVARAEAEARTQAAYAKADQPGPSKVD
ncbi:MAG: hypothetical protein ACE366_10790 [Bradymonadia bacterium]